MMMQETIQQSTELIEMNDLPSLSPRSHTIRQRRKTIRDFVYLSANLFSCR